MPSMPRSERMQVVPFQRPYRCRHRLCIPCRYPLRQPNPAPRRPAFQNRRLGDTDPRPGGRSLRREHLHLPAHIGDYNGDRERGIFRSRWAIISQDRAFFCHDGSTDAKLLADLLGFRPWRDDYSNLFAL